MDALVSFRVHFSCPARGCRFVCGSLR